jgi:glycosyltransferase involved in cell wall biosynthesis
MPAPERRALFIAPMLPAQTGNGLAIRLGLFAEALARVARTDVLCIPLFAGAPGDGLAARLGLGVETIDPAGQQDTQFRLLSRLSDPAARLTAFRQYGRPSLSAGLSLPVLAQVRQLIETGRYDLVHAGRAYLMPAGALAEDIVATADLDEDDAWSWRSLAAIRPTPDAARWDIAEAEAADRALRELAPRFQALFISGPADARRLARRHPGLHPIIVPNPAPAMVVGSRHDDGRTIIFVGSFGYAPNLDGIDWFVRAIWPRVHRVRPELRLRIIGRDLPASLATLDGGLGIEAAGAVEDLRPVYQTATLAIAPLRAGGGTRIKLIEAAALGVPIVSTSLAARGLSFGDRRGMWIADSEAAFADAVIEAADRPDERAKRAGHARGVALRRHDRKRVVARLACRFAALLAK